MRETEPIAPLVNDLTTSVEFLMVAVRELIGGAPLDDREVQQNLDFALRLVLPLKALNRSNTIKGVPQPEIVSD